MWVIKSFVFMCFGHYWPPSEGIANTNSDSPSAKSKGVRLVSATYEVNQAKEKGTMKTINHKYN
jgi:hypothetical protein